MNRVGTFVCIAILVCTESAAAADRPKQHFNCVVDDVVSADRPGWLAADDRRQLSRPYPKVEDAENVPPLWTSDEPPISLAELAERAAPILIFSPLEFLLKEFPPISVPSAAGELQPAPQHAPIVYYRIRSIRLRPNRQPKPATKLETERILDAKWSCQDPATRRIDELDYLTIRYFFYYPQDAGVGGHAHDLEAIELQIRSRPFCVDAPLNTESPPHCFYALTLASAAGSAHGAGWYTNVLSVEDTSDTVLPIAVIVERDKHASSPDRDGDGVYQPYRDTNKYTKDAWGIRDVVGSGWLGGAAFRGDTNDSREDGLRLYPPSPAKHLRDLHNITQKRHPWGDKTYKLRRSETAPVCHRKFEDGDNDRRLESLLEGKNFCGDGGTEVKVGTVWFAETLQAISPGPSGRYGFMSYYQRLSFAMRLDDGPGVSMVAPVGTELKLVGGWIVPKINFVPTWAGWLQPNMDVNSFGIDLLYAPTGSRFTDWYIAGGAEHWRDEEYGGLRWGKAVEGGVKYRFNLENLKHVLGFQFVGFRLAVRTTYSREKTEDDVLVIPSAWKTRVIFEVGAGSW